MRSLFSDERQGPFGPLVDTNIDMYVQFGKSLDDVTFRVSLRHLFCPGLKKTMEHNLT